MKTIQAWMFKRKELERERLRVAACDVAAMQNTPASVEESAFRAGFEMADYIASCDDAWSRYQRERKGEGHE